MCLEVSEAQLGPADVALDLREQKLLLRPGLTRRERTVLARRVLAGAGMEQPCDVTAVTCLCGFPLRVSPASGRVVIPFPLNPPAEPARTRKHGRVLSAAALAAGLTTAVTSAVLVLPAIVAPMIPQPPAAVASAPPGSPLPRPVALPSARPKVRRRRPPAVPSQEPAHPAVAALAPARPAPSPATASPSASASPSPATSLLPVVCAGIHRRLLGGNLCV